jgi:hypothetical protein
VSVGTPAGNAAQRAVEIGEHRGVVRVPRRVFRRLLPERPTPERCIEAYYLQRTWLEGIAERKLRRRQLTEDGNVEISGRNLRLPTAAVRDIRRLSTAGTQRTSSTGCPRLLQSSSASELT